MRSGGVAGRHRRIPRRATLACLFGMAAALNAPTLGAFDEIVGEIIIEPTSLRPSSLLTEPEHGVRFVNRTGRTVHVQFVRRDPAQHHLVQVPDHAWAVFHQPGHHEFVVHFPDGGTRELRGSVIVVENPYGRPDPRVCGGVTVQGACLER